MQCVDCVNEGKRSVRGARTLVGAEDSGRRVLITPILIALNVLAYLVTVVQSGSVQDNDRSDLFQTLSLIPPFAAAGEYWRFVTSGFLHFGLLHLALNMAVLYIVGNHVEPELGRLRFVGVYFLSLLGGSAAAFYFGSVCQNLAGASGAVFGLMGALLVVWRRKKRDISTVVVVVVINLVSNFFTNASLLGHLGGSVIGGLLTLAMVKAPRETRNVYTTVAFTLAILLLLGMFALRTAQLDTLSEIAAETLRTCR
ncbi:Membrane associated serine protease, rhomboid family [Lentzea flava]|nr:Membrane associated serine protease, rhomboid family [Lentzea flava]